MSDNTLTASARTEPGKLATALEMRLRETHGKATVRVIGAEALNQAIKAVITTRVRLSALGVDVVTRLGFVDVEPRGGGDVMRAIDIEVSTHG